MGPFNALLSELMSVGVRVMTDVDGQNLFYIEAYTVGVQLTVLVVDVDLSFSVLIWQEYILIEDTRHGRCSLIDTAPGFYMTGLRLSFTSHKSNGPFTDNEHLFVFHFVVFVKGAKSCLDAILYLCFWFFGRVMFFKIDGGWNAFWQMGLKLNLVDTGLQHSVNDLEDWAFEFEELF